jgi:alpha-beta hydrolase superfamily lysophospholipase
MGSFRNILFAVCVFSIVSGIVLCEGSLRVRRHDPISPASADRPGAGFRQTDAGIEAADHVVLRAWFLQPAAPAARCVAVLHGIGDSRLGARGFAPMFLHAGYAVLLPDSRGHGQSGGAITTYGLLEADDVLRWAGWMRAHGCREVFGLGESLGAAILLEAAGRQPAFNAIAAECSYSSFPAIAKERLARATQLPAFAAKAIVWPVMLAGMTYARIRYGIDLWRVDPAAAARKATIPILLIHGMDDRRTSTGNSRRIAAAAPRAKLWLVPGADHVSAYATDPRGFESRVLGFFASNTSVNGLRGDAQSGLSIVENQRNVPASLR